MNRTFEENGAFNSNRRIFDAYYESTKVTTWKDKVLAFATAEKTRRIAKLVGIALSLVGMIGVMGAMELEAVGLLGGVILGGVFIAVEALCIRA